ncbi:MAG: hypothetical protein AAGI51_16080 [Pseudomonadota bacterium]
MIRAHAAAALFAALALAAGPAPVSASPGSPSLSAPELDDHRRTCRHYENRARFKQRGPGAALETRLADHCAAALSILSRGAEAAPARARRARAYLERLTLLKTTIIDINRERIYGENPARFAQPRADLGSVRAALVTPTGEYLIARHMGVLDALEAWSAGEAVLKADADGSAAQPAQPAEQPDG